MQLNLCSEALNVIQQVKLHILYHESQYYIFRLGSWGISMTWPSSIFWTGTMPSKTAWPRRKLLMKTSIRTWCLAGHEANGGFLQGTFGRGHCNWGLVLPTSPAKIHLIIILDGLKHTWGLWLNPHTLRQWTCLQIWTCSIIYWNPQSC